MTDPLYESFMGLGPRRLAHWNSWSCPDAETYITCIDFYDHPRQCRLKMNELYPDHAHDFPVPEADHPWPRPGLGGSGASSDRERHTVRWGTGETTSWRHGEQFFHCPEDVFAFSPLEQDDFSPMHGGPPKDVSSEERIYRRWRKHYPEEWGDHAPEGSSAHVSYYTTMFMWPMLTFGWELFLECCLDPRFDRIMEEFAEINRREFRAFTRLPINFVLCHDDIVISRGPVCSPEWMHKHIFPRYEEFWDIVRSAGKEVLFITDGRADVFVDDVMACGARGIQTEPYTDFKAIAQRHKDCYLGGEGDERVLRRNNPKEIRAMVESMVETGRMSGGYVMSIGQGITWNVPPEAVKLYLDLSAELAFR